MKTLIDGEESDWGSQVQNLWKKFVLPLFKENEKCNYANFFTKQPYRNKGDKGRPKDGFSYIVMPGNRVCVKEIENETT